MKRLAIPVALVAALIALPASSAHGQSCPTHPLYAAQGHAQAMFKGTSPIPKRAWRTQIRLVGCQRDLVDQGIVRRLDHRLHQQHSARVAATKAQAAVANGFASSEDDIVPGVPEWFASCVAWYESTDGALSSNRYGILGGGGTGTLEQQKRAFAAMYASASGPYGHMTPWAPYDGCGRPGSGRTGGP